MKDCYCSFKQYDCVKIGCIQVEHFQNFSKPWHLAFKWNHLFRTWISFRLGIPEIMDCSPSDSSVHSISQARILESVAIPFSRGSSQPRDQNCISMSQALGGGFFTTRATWEGSPSKLLSKGSLSCCKHLKKVCVNLLKFLALDNSSLEG